MGVLSYFKTKDWSILCRKVNVEVLDIILLIGFLVGSAGAIWLGLKYVRSRNKVQVLHSQALIQQVEIDHLQIYKTVVQESPDLFVIVDQGLQVLVANKTATQYDWQSGRGFLDASIAETSKIHFQFELSKVLKDGFPSDGEVRLLQVKHNSWKFFMYHIFPIMDSENRIVGATVTAVDVTAQREAEDELNRQRDFIEEIMNAIPDVIYVKDDHQRYLYGNKLFSEMVGKSVENFALKSDSDLFSSVQAESLKKHDRDVLRTNVPSEVEEEISNREGKKWTVLTKRIPFEILNGRRVLIAIMRDFSERKRLEGELQVSKARQEEASRLATLGETAGGIAHEINNPLNVLVGVAELMKAKVEKDGIIEREKLDDYCDRIVKYSMRIAKIIKGLRSISRDASQDPFTEVSLTALVDETLELCRQQFANRGIDLKILSNEKEIFVSGRFAQLSQILMNLMNNARDAIEGIQQPVIQVEIGKQGDNGFVRVWDNGPGVSIELEEKIMKPFFTTKPAGKGTGLGLSISKSIALDHKGNLTLNRKVSASCFELQIPLLTDTNKSAA